MLNILGKFASAHGFVVVEECHYVLKYMCSDGGGDGDGDVGGGVNRASTTVKIVCENRREEKYIYKTENCVKDFVLFYTE